MLSILTAVLFLVGQPMFVPSHFFAGQPASGYLVTHVAAPNSFLERMRTMRHHELVTALQREFAFDRSAP